MSRLKNVVSILFPLLFSSMERIDVVSNAMELRGFGKMKARTWYSRRKLSQMDVAVLVFIALFVVLSMIITFHDGNRFYNPF
jgi:energy-coupling factor transport system permease protein